MEDKIKYDDEKHITKNQKIEYIDITVVNM